MNDRVVLTKQGAEVLQSELSRLKKTERPRVIQAIAEARAHGDLSENAEYHAAREEQSFLEGRIKLLAASLSGAELIDPVALNAGKRIVFGAYVTIYDVETEVETSYQIVGELEADLSKGQISLASPIAKALLAKNEGDEVVVQAPAGEKIYEVIAVDYH
ncbi:MAG: transcription elongation factor GreA [Parasphingorhabdus sp.]|jgi:transcription elongation factor GreA